MARSTYWDEYNKQQKKTMEEQAKKNRGKKVEIKIGDRTPSGPARKAPKK